MDWRERGRVHLASTSAGNDLGHRTVLTVLQRFLDNGCQFQGDAKPPRAPEALERSRQINPTGQRLKPEDKERLATVLNEFATKRRKANEDLYITSKICESRAIQAGDFETHTQPPPDTPHDAKVNLTSAAMQRAQEANAGFFSNPADENLTTAPGADHMTWRIIVLRPETSPEYVAVKRYLSRLDAEEAIAVRSFFVGGTERR